MRKVRSKNKGCTHRIRRIGPIWSCLNDGCSFFIYFKQEYILIARNLQCFDCGQSFRCTDENLKQMEMRCPVCHANYEDALRYAKTIPVAQQKREIPADIDLFNVIKDMQANK